MTEFEAAIHLRIDDLRDQLRAALMDDDFAEAARVDSALSDLERLRRDNGPAAAGS